MQCFTLRVTERVMHYSLSLNNVNLICQCHKVKILGVTFLHKTTLKQLK
jgi:hypothetical protein